jgi:periplasmic divalent cation tolerance protein
VLLIKTRKSLAKRLERRVRELHPYEVPEFLVIPVAAGSRGYLAWIAESTRP